jgi:hypothetical protein
MKGVWNRKKHKMWDQMGGSFSIVEWPWSLKKSDEIWNGIYGYVVREVILGFMMFQ